MWEGEASQALELQSGPGQTVVGGTWDSLSLPQELPPSSLPLEQPVGMPNIPEAWEEFGWGRVVGALRPSAPLPLQHELPGICHVSRRRSPGCFARPQSFLPAPVQICPPI